VNDGIHIFAALAPLDTAHDLDCVGLGEDGASFLGDLVGLGGAQALHPLFKAAAHLGAEDLEGLVEGVPGVGDGSGEEGPVLLGGQVVVAFIDVEKERSVGGGGVVVAAGSVVVPDVVPLAVEPDDLRGRAPLERAGPPGRLFKHLHGVVVDLVDHGDEDDDQAGEHDDGHDPGEDLDLTINHLLTVLLSTMPR
jgi:hypothetical protein